MTANSRLAIPVKSVPITVRVSAWGNKVSRRGTDR